MLIKLSKSAPDIILITGDYYIDHPSFGIAIIARLLQNLNYSVWIVSQPDPHNNFRIFKNLPAPSLFFGITSGAIDSNLNLYTVNKVKRRKDAFSENGKIDKRIRNSLITYTNAVRNFFPKSLILLGGLEASVKRYTYYDFFDKKLRPGILDECSADFLLYGMAENTIKKIASYIKNRQIKKAYYLRGLCFKKNTKLYLTPISLPSFDDLKKKKKTFLSFTKKITSKGDFRNNEVLSQKQNKSTIIYNPAPVPLSEEEMNKIYSLNFTYKPLPESKKFIKAYETVKNTVITHRGCGGGCSFCSISLHQGKIISSRSINNIIEEIKKRKLKTVTDIQSPTANMYRVICLNKNKCNRFSCLFPEICHYFKHDSNSFLTLLKKLNKLNKKIYISSGIRFDIIKEEELSFIIKNDFISGQLKIAPEHTDKAILQKMHKPDKNSFIKFCNLFNKLKKKHKKDFYIIPYIISGFPGGNNNNTKKLSTDLKNILGFVPYQIQDFTPTPMTIATAIYFAYNCEFKKGELKAFRNILSQYSNKKKHNTNKKSTGNKKNNSGYKK
ncbi:MAG: YgiQ family radical SAM protein [Candidatus Muiribacteriota bacterium]